MIFGATNCSNSWRVTLFSAWCPTLLRGGRSMHWWAVPLSLLVSSCTPYLWVRAKSSPGASGTICLSRSRDGEVSTEKITWAGIWKRRDSVLEGPVWQERGPTDMSCIRYEVQSEGAVCRSAYQRIPCLVIGHCYSFQAGAAHTLGGGLDFCVCSDGQISSSCESRHASPDRSHPAAATELHPAPPPLG